MAGEFLKIDLNIPGVLEELIANPQKVREIVSGEMTRAGNSAGQIGLSSIKIGTPISNISHPHLIDQEYFSLTQTNVFKQELAWFTDVKYAGFVNNGTKFMTGRHFFDGGINRVQPRIEAEYGKVPDRVVKRLGG
jgi:hypothetical protein